MIRINLATRKQSLPQGEAKEAGGGLFAKLGSISLKSDEMKALPIRKVALMAAVAIGAYFVVEDFKTTELQKVDKAIEKLTTEKTRLQAEANKIKEYEALKKQLDADEFLLRNKIGTIEWLVAERHTPQKIMISLAENTPKDVWLTKFKIDNGKVTISGNSLGYNQISDFMKSLSENIFFQDLVLQNTAKGRDDRGAEVMNFDLGARRRQ